MADRIHSVSVYKVEYGNTISSQLTDQVLKVFYNAENRWISEDERDGEIDRQELLSIIEDMEDGELKDALILLEKESDKSNDFVRFSLF